MESTANAWKHAPVGVRKKSSVWGWGQQGEEVLGHGSGESTTPQGTQDRIMVTNNFIQDIIAGKSPVKCTDKRGITVLMQEPMSCTGLSMEETAPRLWGQARTEALGCCCFPTVEQAFDVCIVSVMSGNKSKTGARFCHMLTDATLHTNTNSRALWWHRYRQIKPVSSHCSLTSSDA